MRFLRCIDKQMKVSVIIPVYNVEKYIKRCLESIERQTLKDFELVIINDGSQDDSQKIIDEFTEKKTCEVQCLIKKNEGQAAARNKGIKMAHGEYIAFVDSDDYLEDDYLETLYNAAQENGSQVVVCGYYQVDERGKMLRKVQITNKNVAPYERAGMSVVWGKLFERKFLIENNFEFQEGGKIFEDVPYAICTKFQSENPIAIKYCGYYYVQRVGSTMNSTTVKSNRFPYEKMTEAIESSNIKVSTEIKKKLEFEVLHFWAGFLFRYCRKAEIEDIKKLVDYSKKILADYFPEYFRNPYVGITKNREQPLIDRCAVWVFVLMNRLGCINLFVKIITRI